MAQPQEYSPTAIQPYEAAPAPPTPAAAPSPLAESPGFQFQGHGNISHGGAIAGIFDGVLKGFVNGHAMGEAHKALTLKKKSDDLNTSYNADAKRLYEMHASGVDEKSAEYQAAKSAVDGSWGALQDFRGQLIDGQQGKKKTSKGAKTGQDDPMMALSNPAASPQEKAAALYAISKKLGPPVYGQIASLNTPQAQQARATQSAQAGVDAQHVTNAMTHEQAQATYNKYAGKTEEEMAALPEAEQQAYRNARAVLIPPTNKGTTRLYESPDKKSMGWYVPDNQPEGWNARATGATPKNVRAWRQESNGKFTSVMIDPATNQMVPGTENGDLAPPASLSGHTTDKNYHWVDSDSNVHATPDSSSTHPTAQASGIHAAPPTKTNPPTVVTPSFHSKPVPGLVEKGNVDVANRPNIDNGDGTHSSVFSMSFGTDKGEVLVPGVGDGKTYPQRKLTKDEALDQYKKTGQNLGTFKDEKAANAYAQTLHEDQAKHGKAPVPPNTTRRERVRTPTAPAPAATPGAPAGDRILGHKGTTDETTAKKNADTLELAARQSLERMKNVTSIGDTGIVFNWVRAQVAGAGRMTNTEIQQAIQSGSMETKFKNAYDRAATGKLDDQFRREMVNDTLMLARQARIVANTYKPKTAAAVPSPSSKGIVSIDEAMQLAKYKGKSRKDVSDAIAAQGYTPQ